MSATTLSAGIAVRLKWLPTENPTDAQSKMMVVKMPTGCNAAIRAINCYLHWNSQNDGRCSSAYKHPKVQQLKEPRLVMPTFTAEHVRLLIHYKPVTDFQKRLHVLLMILLDPGCRVSEALRVYASYIATWRICC